MAPSYLQYVLDCVRANPTLLSKIKPRDRGILERRYGLAGMAPETRTAVARSLGVSVPRIFQLEHRGLRMLRHVCPRELTVGS